MPGLVAGVWHVITSFGQPLIYNYFVSGVGCCLQFGSEVCVCVCASVCMETCVCLCASLRKCVSQGLHAHSCHLPVLALNVISNLVWWNWLTNGISFEALACSSFAPRGSQAFHTLANCPLHKFVQVLWCSQKVRWASFSEKNQLHHSLVTYCHTFVP